MNARARITRAAGAISGATLISRVLGYVKDMILARYFGATGVSDVFFVAFRIPNLLRELFAEGSMSSAFIPVLTEYQTKEGRNEANRLVRATFFFIIAVVGLICVVGVVFAPAIVSVIAPGFSHDSGKFAATVLLTRIMFPFLLFISLAALIMGALNTRGAFFVPALAPAMLNIAIIGSVVSLSQQFAQPIVAVAVGVAAGGLAQLLFQVPSFLRHGFRLGFSMRSSGADRNEERTRHLGSSFRHPGLRKIGLLIIPSTAAMAVAQINIFVSTILGTFLPEGSVTYLYYSMRLIQFPIGVFGVALGMAVLPALSEHAVKGDMTKLKEDFSFALRLLFFMTVPAMTGLIALGGPIVNVLFQRGRFDLAATLGTSEALMFYSFGIWAIVGVRTVTAAFYSMQDTATPVKVAVCAMAINIVASLLLMNPLKHNGLALANSVAATSNFVVLFYFLRRKLGGVGTAAILRSVGVTAAASAVMGTAAWLLLRGDLWLSESQTALKALYLTATILVCAVLYVAVAFLLRSEEARYVLGLVRKRFSPTG